MADEHDDDAEAEVDEGTAVETQNFGDAVVDHEGGEPSQEADDRNADEDSEPIVDDEAPDTI